jgi:ferredoxin
MAALHIPRVRSALTTRHIGRLIQASVTLFIGLVAAGHTLAGEGMVTTAPSAEAFCPFGGVETLEQYIASGGSFINHTHLSNLVLLAAVLVLSVVARRVLCLDLPVRCAPGVAVRRERLATATCAAAPTLIRRVDGVLRYGKYVVLALILGGTVAHGVMVFRDYDPWSALLEIGALVLTAGTVVLGAVLLASPFVERPWCRYACPLGAVIGLAGRASPLRIQREGSACTGCTLCDKRCPMGLPVATMSELTHRDCVMCLECVDACPRPGALDSKLVVRGVRAER